MRPSLVSIAAALCFAVGLVSPALAQEEPRFVLITHAPATDPFWATIRSGAEAAARDMGVELEYRAPDSFDLAAMGELVAEAVEESPDGLIVSIPNAEILAPHLQAAAEADLPVISINSGFEVAENLGVLLHVGQGEYDAGRVAGEQMRELGGVSALCLNHEVGNAALDLRCKGFIDGFAGSVEVVAVESEPAAVATVLQERLAADEGIDAVLALSASIAGEPAIEAAAALAPARRVRVATFDLTEVVLESVAAERAAFAIDQQPFLQGYLPVQYLALKHRYGVVPVSNVATGPMVVSAKEAARRLEASGADSGASSEEPPAAATGDDG